MERGRSILGQVVRDPHLKLRRLIDLIRRRRRGSPEGSQGKGGRPVEGSRLWMGMGREGGRRETRSEAKPPGTTGFEAQAQRAPVPGRSCGQF